MIVDRSCGRSFSPPFLIGCIALAFSKDDPSIFKIGVNSAESNAIVEFIKQDYNDVITYENRDAALQRIRHHQLDLYIEAGDQTRYWVNPESSKGRAAEQLLANLDSLALDRVPISGRAIRYVDWVVPGILGMNLMFSGLFGVGYVVVRYRKNGVLKRLKATPVTELEFVTAQLLSRLMIMLVVSVTIYSVANVLLDLLMLGSYFDLFVVAVIGNVALLAIALVVASRTASEELANGILNFFTMPMLLLSEVWFSLDGVPQWMVWVSQCLPLTHMVQAARKIMIEGATLIDVSHHLIVLAVMALVSLFVAARVFRWN